MAVFSKELSIKTRGRNVFHKITDEMESVLKESKIKNGILTIFNPHTTSAVLITENDEDLHGDILEILGLITPENKDYKHVMEGKENAIAHIRSTLIGNSLLIPVKNGKLELGGWQDIFLLESFEGRNRSIEITIVGE